MDLIERYLHEVGRFLSPKNRDDILKELRSLLVDNLESRREGEATEEDVVAVLKEFGPPQKVAASYWPEGQYLIGPTLFPNFRIALSLTLLVMVIVFSVLIGVLVVFNGQYKAALDLLGSFFNSAMTALGIIVIIFYLLQTFGYQPEKSKAEWDPRSLPAVEDTKTIKRREMLVDIAFSIVLTALLLVFRNGIPYVTTAGGEVNTVINPVFYDYLPLVILALLVGIIIDVVLLWRGRWTLGMRLVKIAGNLFDLVVIGVLIAAHQAWLAPYTDGTFVGFFTMLANIGAEMTQETIQVMVVQGFLIGLVVAFIVESLETLGQIYNLVRQSLGLDRMLVSTEEI
jgi:hypothetical protein